MGFSVMLFQKIKEKGIKIVVKFYTTETKQEKKLERKFRKTYHLCNEWYDKNIQCKKIIAELTAENRQLKRKRKANLSTR